MKALGVYIFAGGFTLGVKRAGFDVAAQLEDGPYGVATTRLNHPGLPVHADPDAWPLESFAGVDFVYGNPPCAPFSNSGVSNKKVGMMDDWWRTDPRASCVTKMFHVLEVARPKVWAWESVQPALRRGAELVAELTAIARTMGYAASYVLIDAHHLGVPQKRRRVFVVFHKVAIPWEYPAPGAKLTTVREAWEPILSGRAPDPELAAGVVPRHCIGQYNGDGILDRLPQGGSLKKLWEAEHPPETRQLNAHGKVRGRPGFLYKRLAWGGQSPTLTGSASKTFHPAENRYITVLEKQLLCGYPETYEFVGSPINKLAQIAQAVMPPVGEWLARNVARAVEAGVPAELETRVVDLESTWRSPEPIVVTRTMSLTVKREPRPERLMAPAHEPARPAQDSILEVWAEFTGPTALARVLIAEGHADGPILAAAKEAMAGAKAAGAKWPKLFTKIDLARLRARIEKTTKGEAA